MRKLSQSEQDAKLILPSDENLQKALSISNAWYEAHQAYHNINDFDDREWSLIKAAERAMAVELEIYQKQLVELAMASSKQAKKIKKLECESLSKEHLLDMYKRQNQRLLSQALSKKLDKANKLK